MIKFTRRFAFLTIALGLLGMSRPAHATLTVTLSDGNGHTSTFTDSTTPGLVTILPTTIGNFTVSGSADAPPTPGDSTPNEIVTTQATLSISANGVGGPGGTLTITEVATPDNFTPPNAAATLTADFAPTRLTAGGSATYSSTAVGTSTATAGDGPITAVGNYSQTALFTPASVGPFTVTSVLKYTPGHVNDQMSDSFTTTLNAVPEPATLAMAFSALPLLGIAAWRSRRKAS